MIKYALKFDAKKPSEFIESVRDLIFLQYRNDKRAILGKGPYRISPLHCDTQERKLLIM